MPAQAGGRNKSLRKRRLTAIYAVSFAVHAGAAVVLLERGGLQRLREVVSMLLPSKRVECTGGLDRQLGDLTALGRAAVRGDILLEAMKRRPRARGPWMPPTARRAMLLAQRT